MLFITLTIALAQSQGEAPSTDGPAGLEDVTHALSYRHAKPCSELEALTTTPVATLRHVVQEVQMPPWAPMRAAECLQRNHAQEVRDDLLRWVSEPEMKGLGRQVVGLLDVLPEPLAVEVAREALVGPVAERARVVMARDTRPGIVQLLEGQLPEEVSP